MGKCIGKRGMDDRVYSIGCSDYSDMSFTE